MHDPIVDVLSDIFLRAEILCLKTLHIIHHWKELIEERCLVPSFRQMVASEGSYGPPKWPKWPFQKVRLLHQLISILLKFFYSILFVTLFYTKA